MQDCLNIMNHIGFFIKNLSYAARDMPLMPNSQKSWSIVNYYKSYR